MYNENKETNVRYVPMEELKQYIEELDLEVHYLKTKLDISDHTNKLLVDQLYVAEKRICDFNQLPWYKRLFHTV